ncbi:MAG: magnesium transporter CorA [Lachnospiraceae bacterium]|nr:magnesium transporter CorA [Lachnospiraceae bacterium]
MFYLIKEQLQEVDITELKNANAQYVAVLTPQEWAEKKDFFDLGIDIDPQQDEIYTTKAVVNFDSLTGSFYIPDRNNVTENYYMFSFVLDEKGIIFIDNSGRAQKMIKRIYKAKKWRMPSLERFIYDFLEQIIYRDLQLFEKYELELNEIEDKILEDAESVDLSRITDIRNDIRELRAHYEQLTDFGQELEENENEFFQEENLRYFRLFLNRMDRLRDTAHSLHDFTMQVRDLQHTQLDIKQNHIMALLTVITTIFMPLTLIVGWYGMNFKYMPELEWKASYPIVIGICVLIVVASLIFFKKKKWL